MLYKSTRNDKLKLTAAEVVVKGLSDDGGLFVPEDLKAIPKIDKNFMLKLGKMSYAERAAEVFKLFLSGYSDSEIDEITQKAYSDNFSVSDVAEIHRVSAGAYFLELWHGPTCAFKDMALQALPRLLTAAQKDEKRQTVILTATSGDTGKAALEGFKDVSGTKIIVFYPIDGVSDAQKAQMQTQEGENVFVVGIKGNFDDCQNAVKSIFTDEEFNAELNKRNILLSSANSINWGRLCPQIAYYISAYVDLVRDGEINVGDPVNVCVPTGNFGNILAAYYAREIGIPFAKLLCASNKNNVLSDFIQTGVYDRKREFFPTISPSMDILISSNLERLLFHLYDDDAQMTTALMNSLKETGEYRISSTVLDKLQEVFYSESANEDETKAAIKHLQKNRSYLVDPHTAVAFHVYKKYKRETGDETKTIILSTANPFKFSASVLEALTDETVENCYEADERLIALTSASQPLQLAELKGKKMRFTEFISREEIKNITAKFLE